MRSVARNIFRWLCAASEHQCIQIIEIRRGECLHKISYVNCAHLSHLSRTADFVAAGRARSFLPRDGEPSSEVSDQLSEKSISRKRLPMLPQRKRYGTLLHAEASSNRRYKIKHQRCLGWSRKRVSWNMVALGFLAHAAIGFIDREETREESGRWTRSSVTKLDFQVK
jgi:hypothetical protein